MNPKIWGATAWDFLHQVTLAYPINPTDEDKQNYYDFFQSIKNVLPCSMCRNNLKKHLNKYPLSASALESRSTLVKWVIDLHNIVNYEIGKPMLTYDEAYANLDKLSRPKQKNRYVVPISIIITIVVLIISLIFLYTKFKK